MLIAPQFDNTYDFSEELIAIKIGDNWGYINKIGHLVIKPQFDSAWSFQQGVARVRIDDRYAFISHPLIR